MRKNHSRFFGFSSFAILSCIILLCALLAVGVALGQTITVLHNFTAQEGRSSLIGMIQASDGNFYGTTASGGAFGCGTVYKSDQNGNLTILHSFSANGIDGCGPLAGLIQANDGNFYGTTDGGGTGGNNGTIFRMDRNGNFFSILSFDGTNGRQPSRLIQATDGMFYGTTPTSGAANPGTVFRLDGGGNITTLHSFTVSEGSQMRSGLIQASDGNFYGTAESGGSNACSSPPTFQSGCGTVFKIDWFGNVTVLHSFTGSDGTNPSGGLIQAADGQFYGTTVGGGPSGFGTVFRIDAAGNFTTVHSFTGGDGAAPRRLIQATDGNFYGTTLGDPGFGTIFKMDVAGSIITLHTFQFSDGYKPFWLIQASDGRLYGTTIAGGSSDLGVIFGGPSAGPPPPTPTPTPSPTPTPTPDPTATPTPTPTPSPTPTPTPTPSPTPLLDFDDPPERVQKDIKTRSISKRDLMTGLLTEVANRRDDARNIDPPDLCLFGALDAAKVTLNSEIATQILWNQMASPIFEESLDVALGGLPIYAKVLFKAGSYWIERPTRQDISVDASKFVVEKTAKYVLPNAVEQLSSVAGELTAVFVRETLNLDEISTVDIKNGHNFPFGDAPFTQVNIRIVYSQKTGYIIATITAFDALECGPTASRAYIIRYEPVQKHSLLDIDHVAGRPVEGTVRVFQVPDE